MSPGTPVVAPSRHLVARRAATVVGLWLVAAAMLAAPVAADEGAGSPSSTPATESAPAGLATPALEPASSPAASPSAAPSPSPAPSPAASPSSAASPSPTVAPTPTLATQPLPSEPTPTLDPGAATAPSSPPPASPILDPVTGEVLPAFSLNLYRSRAFVRQYTGTWCVAAATMTMANTLRVIREATSWVDRTYTRQRQIIRYAKSQDTLRRSDGSDPRGWAAALRRYGGGTSYRERAFASYEAAVRYAAERIRATGKPVGILAWHGSHAWVMHGFTASADPAVTDEFTVSSVWISGPLVGTDPRNGELAAASFQRRWGRYLQRDGYRGWYKRWLLVAP